MSVGIAVYTLAEYEALSDGDALAAIIAGFSCPLNSEVEDFLRNKAWQSSRLLSTVSYLVMDVETGALLGYFTLMSKPYAVKREVLSATNRKLISRFAEFDSETDTYTASVFLIAQIGKNYAVEGGRRISGADLLALAKNCLRQVRQKIGGKLVLVEREMNRPKLLPFYQCNGFKSWTVRHSERDGMDYDQMIAVI